ncbi:MAG TPA: hypothetical protein VF665_19820 [Longimicrobium sp.]|uniref:hypothetical protein n=1 Tax=Longimicrobium sp. TaxID=2029185 RepID=UPI002ED9DA65
MKIFGWTRRHPRGSALLLGLALSLGEFWFTFAAPGLLARLTGNPDFADYDARPGWFALLMTLIGWLPWLGLAAFIVIRLAGRKWSRPLAYFGGIATVYAGVLVYVLGGIAFESYWNAREFEPAAWRANDKSDPSRPVRLRMADDLVASGRLSGLHRTEVERLLGPPGDKAMWKDWDMVYYLGPERGLLSLDSEWLVIRLGTDGRVLRHEIVRD